jgi:hypothetical protein
MSVKWGSLASITLLLCSTTWAGVSPFSGEWVNKAGDSSDFSKLEIAGSGSQLSVKASGSCKTADCDWAPTLGTVYADDTHADMDSAAKLLVALFPTNQGEKLVLMKQPAQYQLQIQVLTRYRGNTESNYVKTYSFERTDIPKEPVADKAKPEDGDTANPTAQAHNTPALTTPEQLSPGNGKTLYNYPRNTTLTWKEVPGAAAYGIEVDCFNCCQFNKWCSTLGQPWLQENKITATRYTFEFIGPQAARWRVWSVGADGAISEKSPWRNFKYGH